MLNFVLGRSRTGKTTFLLDKIGNLALNGEKKLMIIVPDQSSFDTEKKLLENLGPLLSGNIKVFGFTRLCEYIFASTGALKGTPIDDSTRNVIMSIAIEQVRDKLSLFKDKADTKDVLKLMCAAVTEYKKCGVSSESLRKVEALSDDAMLKQKLHDTALVADAYDAVLKNTYIDPLDSILIACEKLTKSSLFSDYTIAVDSYSGFTYSEQRIIEQLLIQSKDFYISLVYDSAGDDDLFFVTKRTKRILSNMANRNSISIAKPIQLLKRYDLNNELSALEKNLFSLNPVFYDEKAENVKVFAGDNIYKEVEYVSAQIKKLVVEHEYRYNDIAVIARDLTPYNGIINTAFNNYDIYYFMDAPQDIQNKPLVKLISACFEVTLKSYQSNKLLEILKTGLTDVNTQSIYEFENYMFVWNINGRSFLSEFKENPSGFTDKASVEDEELLKRLNATRLTLITPIEKFKASIQNADGKQITKALYQLLTELNVEENILKYADALEKNGDSLLAKEQIRLWNTLMDIFDKTVEILKDIRVTPKRYMELLLMQIENAKISEIPRTFDSVTIATADRVRLSEKKAVFVIGAIEGEFPRQPVPAGVFSDSERKTLLSYDLHIDDDTEKLFFHEKLLAYSALSSACERLFVSFYTSALSGEPTACSEIVTFVKNTFKNFVIEDKYCVDFADLIWTKKSAFNICAENFFSTDKNYSALKKYLNNDNEYSEKMKALENASQLKPFIFENSENAKMLFGDDLKVSASQIEKFYLCRFEYFCQYGLKACERKQAKIDSLEYGTLVHYLLERFLKENDRETFSKMTQLDIQEKTAIYLNEYLNNKLGGKENKTERFLYLFNRIKETAANLILRLIDELLQSEFSPVDFELNIGNDIAPYKIKIDDKRTVTIFGSVDRADITEKDGKKYIRIIDYKTGSKKFSLSDVLYGLNLQMLVYLSAVVKNGAARYGGELIPAGVLYMPAISPIVNGSFNMTEEKILEEQNKSLVMSGLILDNFDIIKAMEKNPSNVYIPVSVKNGNIKSGKDNLATLEMFGAIFKKLESLICQMSENLSNGQIQALPAKSMKYDACKWCPYFGVCNFSDDTSPIRAIASFDRERIINQLDLNVNEVNSNGQ